MKERYLNLGFTPKMKEEFKRWSTQPMFSRGAEFAKKVAAENKILQTLKDAVAKQ